MNGTEITVAELNAEAKARGLVLEGNAGLRSALTEEMVDRKLLVTEAEARKLHQTPQHILAERRMREILLAQQLLAGDDSADAGPDQLRAFILAHPHAFGRRITARADLLSFAQPVSPAMRDKLTTAPDLKAMEALLQGSGITFRRSQENWDSADPASPLWGGKVQAQDGTRLFLPRGQETMAVVLSNVTPQPVQGEQQTAVARALLSRLTAEQRMRELLNRARAGATVVYQPGFGPGAGDQTAASTRSAQR